MIPKEFVEDPTYELHLIQEMLTGGYEYRDELLGSWYYGPLEIREDTMEGIMERRLDIYDWVSGQYRGRYCTRSTNVEKFRNILRTETELVFEEL